MTDPVENLRPVILFDEGDTFEVINKSRENQVGHLEGQIIKLRELIDHVNSHPKNTPVELNSEVAYQLLSNALSETTRAYAHLQVAQ